MMYFTLVKLDYQHCDYFMEISNICYQLQIT